MPGIPEIPFNVSYSFNGDLRDVPDDPGQMSAAVTSLEHILASKDHSSSERVQILGLLGGFGRMLGRLDEAEALDTARQRLASLQLG